MASKPERSRTARTTSRDEARLNVIVDECWALIEQIHVHEASNPPGSQAVPNAALALHYELGERVGEYRAVSKRLKKKKALNMLAVQIRRHEDYVRLHLRFAQVPRAKVEVWADAGRSWHAVMADNKRWPSLRDPAIRGGLDIE